MSKEKLKASENMKVFFEKLLELKEFIRYEKDKLRGTEDFRNFQYILEESYSKLDEIIKEKK